MLRGIVFNTIDCEHQQCELKKCLFETIDFECQQVINSVFVNTIEFWTSTIIKNNVLFNTIDFEHQQRGTRSM